MFSMWKFIRSMWDIKNMLKAVLRIIQFIDKNIHTWKEVLDKPLLYLCKMQVVINCYEINVCT